MFYGPCGRILRGKNMQDTDLNWLEEEAVKEHAKDPISYLGSVIISFQEIEHVLVDLLGKLINNSEYAKAIAVELPFKKMANLIDSIMCINKIDQSVIEAYRDCRKLIQEIEEIRNRYVHSYYELFEWSYAGKKYLRSKWSNKNGINEKVEVMDSNKVFFETSDKINKVKNFIIEIIEKI